MHDTRRAGSPDIFIDPRHARYRLKIQSRHTGQRNIQTDINVRESDPRARRNSTKIILPILRGDIKTDQDRQIYKEAVTMNPYQKERLPNNPVPNILCNTNQPVLTPPLSNDENSFERNLDQRVEEIIIDLDDEVEEDERGTDNQGGDSPSYAPNQAITVSEEDQRIFFNKKQKFSKIKTEARRMQDREYVNTVRQLKEKAAELRRLSSNSTILPQRSRQETRTTPANREKDRITMNGHNSERSLKNLHHSFAQNINKSRLSSTPIREHGSNISIASSSTSNILESHSTLYQHNQPPWHQQSPVPPPVDSFSALIAKSCSIVQKRQEMELQKKKEVDRRLLESHSLLSSGALDHRVESLVDKYVGANSSESLVASALRNPENTRRNQPLECRNIADDVISLGSNSPPYEPATPPYQAATPPRLEELQNMRTETSLINANQDPSNVELVCLSSDDESNENVTHVRRNTSNETNIHIVETHSLIRNDVQSEINNVITLDDDDNIPETFPTINQKHLEQSNHKNYEKDIINALEKEFQPNQSNSRDVAVKETNARSSFSNQRSFADELSMGDRRTISKKHEPRKECTKPERSTQPKRRRVLPERR